MYLCARVWENPLTGEIVSPASAATVQGFASAEAGSAPPGMVAAMPAGIHKAANLAALHADGAVTLEDGTRVEGVDTVMYCTGAGGGTQGGFGAGPCCFSAGAHISPRVLFYGPQDTATTFHSWRRGWWR